MIRVFSSAFLLTAGIFLAGCSGFFVGEDNSIPPTELQDINETVQVDTLWVKDVGIGLDETEVNLVPAVIDFNIYTVDREGQVTSLSLETGNMNWQVELDNIITGGIGAGDGVLMVGNTKGELIVLNADTGEQLWRKQLSSVMLAAPLIQDGIIVVRTGDGKVVGLKKEQGEQLWVYDRGVPVLTLRGNSSPIIGGRELVFTGFDSGKIAAVGIKHGRLLWEASAAVARGRSDLERLVDIDAGMILIGRVLYAVTYQGRIVAIDALEGEVLWAKEMSSYAGIAVDERQVYVTDAESNLWAVDRVSGDLLWKQDKLAHRKLTAPASVGDHVMVGDFEGYIHVLSRLDGELIGRKKLDGDGYLVKPVVEGDRIFVYGNGGELSAFRVY
jgi:outer membrane protein assembly factor BamB